MTAAVILAAWGAAAVGLGVLIGRAIKAADCCPHDDLDDDDLMALVQPENWGPDSVDQQFAQSIPDFATGELVSLLGHMDRRFGATS